MKFVDLFAGIGGFRLGLENIRPIESRFSKRPKSDNNTKNELVKWQCIYSNEWNKYCAKIYQKNFGEAPDTRDIRTVPSKEIPDHDLLCAGFPCQSFSIAGKRKGFEDTRGTLFFEIARILRDKRPRYLLLENVKGLLSHQEGETFQTILGVLADLGYRVEWQILNSKYFGVPQNRERVFIVGHLGGEGGFQVFPIKQDIARSDEGTDETTTVRTLQGGGHSGGHHSGMTLIHNVYGGFGEKKVREFKDYSPTIRTPKGGGHLPMVIDYRNRRKMDISATILGNDHNTIHRVIKDSKIRRLTPVECERLQGFPDNWTEGVSDTQRYKMLGNAVTVNVVEAIGLKLLK